MRLILFLMCCCIATASSMLSTGKDELRTELEQLIAQENPDLSRMPNPHRHPSVISAAIREEHADLLEELLKRGADPNTRDEAGGTVFGYLFGLANVRGTRLLLEYGADPHSRCQSLDQNALHIAANNRSAPSPEIIRMLLARNVALDARDKMGETPLMRAVQSFYFAADDSGRRRKEWAWFKPRLDKWHEIIKLLVEQGADIFAKAELFSWKKWGKQNVIEFAQATGTDGIAQLIRQTHKKRVEQQVAELALLLHGIKLEKGMLLPSEIAYMIAEWVYGGPASKSQG